MEADFNATNKVIYGIQMLHNIRKYGLMPEEVYSKRNCLADDGTLSKVLFHDIVWQLRHPTGLVLVDADNCYNNSSPNGFYGFSIIWWPYSHSWIHSYNDSEYGILLADRLWWLHMSCWQGWLFMIEKHKECAKAMAPLRQLGLSWVFWWLLPNIGKIMAPISLLLFSANKVI